LPPDGAPNGDQERRDRAGRQLLRHQDPLTEHDDKIRIEYKIRGNTITIYECRPPWREDFGPDWTSMRICSMQWDPKTELWTLYARNRNDRRLDYPFIEPTPSVKLLGVK